VDIPVSVQREIDELEAVLKTDGMNPMYLGCFKARERLNASVDSIQRRIDGLKQPYVVVKGVKPVQVGVSDKELKKRKSEAVERAIKQMEGE
tara:strand:+ start:575 stop:850 length:276 start_codon:yes stop_codon:yes gene_type:complete